MLNTSDIAILTDSTFENFLNDVETLTNCYNVNKHLTRAVICYNGINFRIRLESDDPNNIFDWVELIPMPNGQEGEWMLRFLLNPNVKLIDNDKYSCCYIKIGFNESRHSHDFSQLWDLLSNVQQ